MGGLKSKMAKMFVFKNGEDKLDDVPKSFFDLKMKDIRGEQVDFNSYRGKHKAFIIVNVASACGLTDANYRQLAKMHEEYGPKGLQIMGFPCNQFKEQENECELDIEKFIREKFNVKFQMFSKIEVNGKNCNQLYRYLRRNSELWDEKKGTAKEIQWNFAKFVLDAEGKVVAFKEPTTKPNEFKPLIEELLRK